MTSRSSVLNTLSTTLTVAVAKDMWVQGWLFDLEGFVAIGHDAHELDLELVQANIF